jgi:hypothetical protein
LKCFQLHILLLLGLVFFNTSFFAFNSNDSINADKGPKHYFKNTVYTDFYAPQKRDLSGNTVRSKKLKSYQMNQFSIGYNFPVYTEDFYNRDSTEISNIHFLVTGGVSNVNLNFGGISTHNLRCVSLGGKFVYNNGRKSILFVEVSPFVTHDVNYEYTRTLRLAGTILYNYSLNQYFSFRVGYTRSFVWGNRYHLPYAGVRIGRLDKINLSIQFPKFITFTVPVNQHIRLSLYTKPQGGVYALANTDSIIAGKENRKLFFGRNEFLSGLRVDVLFSNYFNFYVSSGFITTNRISFYSVRKGRDNGAVYQRNYSEAIGNNAFINFGLVLRFGKTKSIYNNLQMYNAMDINNTLNSSDNGVYNGNGDIPVPAKKIKKQNPQEVADLIDIGDLY